MRVKSGRVGKGLYRSEHRCLTSCIFIFLLLALLSSSACIRDNKDQPKYHFKGKITENVLRNYLARAITLADLCTPPTVPSNEHEQAQRDDLRLIQSIGAKFIGKSLSCCGVEDRLNDTEFLSFAEKTINEVHGFDRDIIFQAAILDAVSRKVERIQIPAKVFEAFGLPATDRSFNYQAMLFSSGLYKDWWYEDCSVPDITKMEVKLWLYFLATTYIDAGFEGIHWGQVELMAHDDPTLEHWSALLAMIRSYAGTNARRRFILNDALAPQGGFLNDGKHLFDFNSSPLRIKAQTMVPMGGGLEQGYLDAIYNRSQGGISPSGWSCKSLPYLVEFDDAWMDSDPVNRVNQCFIWGYNEISWFSLKNEEEQKIWLEYAFNWIKNTDPNGYLQMPVACIVTDAKYLRRWYKANNMSPACPNGSGLEIKIKELWNPLHAAHEP